jgi:hypothetical protein
VAAAIAAEAAQNTGGPAFDHGGEWRSGSTGQREQQAATEPGHIHLGLAEIDRPSRDVSELGPVNLNSGSDDVSASVNVAADTIAGGDELSQARPGADRSSGGPDRSLVVFVVSVAALVASVPIVQRRRLARR